MKNIALLLCTIPLLISCAGTNDVPMPNPKADNYVVVLDLSDRLIQSPNQVNIDTTIINTVFEKFEQSVQKNLVIKSKDKFAVKIIPQHNSSLQTHNFENALLLDMSKHNPAAKLNELNRFKKELSVQLDLLYAQAMLGKTNNKFPGVDIWQYFNEQINTDTDTTCNNKVVVITDGYFDFVNNSHVLNNGNTSTSTTALLAKMNGTDWETQANENKISLIPVQLPLYTKWIICGLQSKKITDLLELKKLSYLWKKWLNNSRAGNVIEPIQNAASSKMKGLIERAL